jgi:hypothetical protein
LSETSAEEHEPSTAWIGEVPSSKTELVCNDASPLAFEENLPRPAANSNCPTVKLADDSVDTAVL